MPKGPLLPSEFIPTKFSSAVDKAESGNRPMVLLPRAESLPAIVASGVLGLRCPVCWGLGVG